MVTSDADRRDILWVNPAAASQWGSSLHVRLSHWLIHVVSPKGSRSPLVIFKLGGSEMKAEPRDHTDDACRQPDGPVWRPGACSAAPICGCVIRPTSAGSLFLQRSGWKLLASRGTKKSSSGCIVTERQRTHPTESAGNKTRASQDREAHPGHVSQPVTRCSHSKLLDQMFQECFYCVYLLWQQLNELPKPVETSCHRPAAWWAVNTSSPQTSFTFRLNHVSGHTSVWNLLRRVRDRDSSFLNQVLESVGVQIMNCGAVLDAVTCLRPQAVYNNKHKAARTTSFTAGTKPSRCHRHNQNQDLRSEEHQVEQSVTLPDTGDSTMFPDLWTSSNLLKMTLSLHREQEQTVTSRRCCDTNGPAQQNRIISDSTESR